MTYSRPINRISSPVHYRGPWAAPEANKPSLVTVRPVEIQEAFTTLTGGQALRLSLLYNSQGALVPTERFGLDESSISVVVRAIRKAGVPVERERDRGYRLPPHGLDFVRQKLEEVRR